jgi:hypothetical protein
VSAGHLFPIGWNTAGLKPPKINWSYGTELSLFTNPTIWGCCSWCCCCTNGTSGGGCWDHSGSCQCSGGGYEANRARADGVAPGQHVVNHYLVAAGPVTLIRTLLRGPRGDTEIHCTLHVHLQMTRDTINYTCNTCTTDCYTIVII